MTKFNENAFVEYHSDLNKVIFNDFKAVELNLFFAICSLLKHCGSERMILEFSEIKKIANYTNRNKKRFEPDFTNTIEKAKSLNFSVYSEFEGKQLSMFNDDKTMIDFEDKKLSISLNPDFVYLLNNFGENSICFSMSDFTNLKSIYSKHLYRLFTEYQDEATYTFSIEAFREFLDINSKYPHMKDIDKRVLCMIKEELNQFYQYFEYKKVLEMPQRVIEIEFNFIK
ncbi:replication initiation protein [Staphylococcus xylosus]|uniref:replication initiation protein n=1 Tax=Staphylococcus xylosus TaxID=1288 RepID=UPI002DBB1431|nr:replication initiation protein [Staphylococcus xylosus]MEB7660081.1 replication initiation protein [Staphylococcus xylosus]MEB7709969.1 replication initiation protein [Staphylococcus xylosus]MEB7785720.1 replication initiation protein [Staphylococcus xylosus]